MIASRRARIPVGSRISVSVSKADILLRIVRPSEQQIIEHFTIGSQLIPLDFGARRVEGSFAQEDDHFVQYVFGLNATDPDRLLEKTEISKTADGLIIARTDESLQESVCILKSI